MTDDHDIDRVKVAKVEDQGGSIDDALDLWLGLMNPNETLQAIRQGAEE